MRYYIMLMMLLISNILNAQYLVLNMYEDIVVYPSDTTDLIFCILPNPIATYADKSNYTWTARILRATEDRFKLEMVLDDFFSQTDPIIGWVDKKQCGVWLRANRYEGRIPIMDIHMNETLDDDFIPLDISGIDFNWVCVTDIHLDSEHHYIYKVKFIYKGVEYSGWVPRCCPDPYDSCT